MGEKMFLCLDVLVHRDLYDDCLKGEVQTGCVRGERVCDDVTCPFLHSGVVQILKAGQVDINNPFCCPYSPLQSSYI